LIDPHLVVPFEKSWFQVIAIGLATFQMLSHCVEVYFQAFNLAYLDVGQCHLKWRFRSLRAYRGFWIE
jgi:hypothetical protein